MKRIIAFTLACLLASPVWAGDFPNPGSASHRARDDGWIDVDNLPFLCDDAHGRGAYNICKENGNGSGLILHEKESIGEGELLTFLNDASNQAVGMALGGGGQFYIQHFANLHFYENGGEDIVFNEGWISPPFERGLDWPGESIRIRSIDDGNLQITVYGGDHGILELYDDNVASINDDEPYNINVYSSNDDDEDINVGGITWIWDDVTLDSEDTRIIFFTTVGGVEEVDQLQISSGVSIGDVDLDPDPNWLGFQANTGIASAVNGPFRIDFPGDTTNNDNAAILHIEARTTNGSFGVAGLGSNIEFWGEDESGVAALQGTFISEWNDADASSPQGSFRFRVANNDAHAGTNQMFVSNGVTVGTSNLGPGTSNLAVNGNAYVNAGADIVKSVGYQHMALMAGAGTVPAGGGIAGCTPVSAFDSGSNDIFLRQCSFSASADNAIYWTVPFPESAHLATDLDVNIRWTSATTTDGSDVVIWNATAACFSDDDAINGNAFPAVDAVNDTQTAAGDILRSGSVSLTPAGSPTDFDTCVIRVSRDADNGSDTFNGTADLISVDLYFVDDLTNEN